MRASAKIVAVLLLIAALGCGRGAERETGPTLAIRNVTVIDGTGGSPLGDATVLVSAGRVAAVGPSASVEVPEGAQIVDGTGKYLIPGLWDMHVHLSKSRASSLAQFVAYGVTSVRDMGGDYAELRRWRSEVQAGRRTGPRIKMAGPYLEAKSNVLRVRLENTVEPEERTRIGIATPAEARQVVDSLARLEIDFIKIRTVASTDTYRAIAEAARGAGLDLVGHTFGVPTEAVVEEGQRSIEHFLPVNIESESERLALFRRLAEQGTAIVPTLVSIHESLFVPADDAAPIVDDSLGVLDERRKYLSAFLIADWREQLAERSPESVQGSKDFYPRILRHLREMRRVGMQVLPGADVAVLLIYPGSSLHDELALLVREVGMTPMEALLSATSGAAEFMGLQDSLGTIEPGQIADLVLLDANPLEDIRNTRSIAAVVQAGRLLDRGAIDELLAGVLRAPDLREDDWSAPDPALEPLRPAYRAFGDARSAFDVERALAVYRELERSGTAANLLTEYGEAFNDLIEGRVNALGYRLLGDDPAEAVRVFELNVDNFPASWNAWDSLAEG